MMVNFSTTLLSNVLYYPLCNFHPSVHDLHCFYQCLFLRYAAISSRFLQGIKSAFSTYFASCNSSVISLSNPYHVAFVNFISPHADVSFNFEIDFPLNFPFSVIHCGCFRLRLPLSSFASQHTYFTALRSSFLSFPNLSSIRFSTDLSNLPKLYDDFTILFPAIVDIRITLLLERLTPLVQSLMNNLHLFCFDSVEMVAFEQSYGTSPPYHIINTGNSHFRLSLSFSTTLSGLLYLNTTELDHCSESFELTKLTNSGVTCGQQPVSCNNFSCFDVNGTSCIAVNNHHSNYKFSDFSLMDSSTAVSIKIHYECIRNLTISHASRMTRFDAGCFPQLTSLSLVCCYDLAELIFSDSSSLRRFSINMSERLYNVTVGNLFLEVLSLVSVQGIVALKLIQASQFLLSLYVEDLINLGRLKGESLVLNYLQSLSQHDTCLINLFEPLPRLVHFFQRFLYFSFNDLLKMPNLKTLVLLSCSVDDNGYRSPHLHTVIIED
ncbi:hypothetical protein RCL1_008089 [Eukaryota sp. TZLM3-RCL]